MMDGGRSSSLETHLFITEWPSLSDLEDIPEAGCGPAKGQEVKVEKRWVLGVDEFERGDITEGFSIHESQNYDGPERTRHSAAVPITIMMDVDLCAHISTLKQT
jgi:hypothetical protein